MNTLETWRSIVEVLGWTLIHFTWQGTLVALLLAGVLRVLRGSSTNARYAAACVALGEMKASAAVESLTSLSLHDENERVRRKAAWALGEIREALAQESTDQASRETKYTGKLAGVTRTLELNFQASQSSKKARLKIDGRIMSGSSVWTLRDPNGKSAFTAESGNAELSLDSGDLDVIPGTWTLQLELKNATLDFEGRWSTR